MAANHWTHAEHVTLISLYLTGSAQLLYQSLPAAVCGGNLHSPLTGTWQLVCSGIAHIDLHHAGLRTRSQHSGEQLLRSSEETGPTSEPNIGCQCSRRLSQRYCGCLTVNFREAGELAGQTRPTTKLAPGVRQQPTLL